MQSPKQVFFSDRDGQTVLSVKERQGLRLSHVTTMKELDEAEQVNISRGLIWLEETSSKNYISETFFKKLHLKLFGEVWRWAGTYRTSEKNIGVSPWKVGSEMYKFIKDVNFWLEEESYDSWPSLLARFHHRLVHIHPFPNGNGRFARIMTNHLCIQNNQRVHGWYSSLHPKKRRTKYIKALRQADAKKYQELTDFFKGS